MSHLPIALAITAAGAGMVAVLLVAILSAVWLFAVSRFLRADAWGEP